MGNTTVRYLYNSSGQRIQKIENEDTADEVIHDYGWEDGHVVYEKAGTKINRYYFDETGSPVAMSLGSEKYIFQKNLQGDIIGVYDADGTLLVKYRYDAWGKVQVTDVTDTTASHSVIARNSYLYRGYWYDWDTGLYYLNSRYYDPETGRFLNADGFVSTGQSVLGCNMFAYCNNNPVSLSDTAGYWPKLSTVLTAIAVVAVSVAAVALTAATCGVASPALAVAGGSIVGEVSVGAATAIATDALMIAGTYCAAAEMAHVAEKISQKKRYRTYSVYFLKDSTHGIKYVGRVTDEGYKQRMTYHFITKNLTPAYRVSGLTYEEARGIEEIGMIECHTLRRGESGYNQIHGISKKNSNGSQYLSRALSYLENRAEQELLNLLQ